MQWHKVRIDRREFFQGFDEHAAMKIGGLKPCLMPVKERQDLVRVKLMQCNKSSMKLRWRSSSVSLIKPSLLGSIVLVVIALLINNMGHKKAWPKYWC